MANTSNIHWVGAGLASGPGIVSLAKSWGKLTLWDMTSERAEMLRTEGGVEDAVDIRLLDLSDDASVLNFSGSISAGDVVVSMLPAALHVQLAEIALAIGAHLVTSSYVSHEMLALDTRAKEAGVSLVNEVGLDPGIDHLFAHLLVDAGKKAGALGNGNAVEFVSYCGGVPAIKNDFTYKFAWTPYGVLTALKNEARFISAGSEKTVQKAWEDVSELAVHGEKFEVYANRDSVPYVEEYGLAGEGNLQKFVRGTLRLEGWREAWKDIFTEVETADPDSLKALSSRLWDEYAYGDTEEDRVVLYVALSAEAEDGSIWQASLTLDEKGSGWKTAMAATVSLTVAQAVLSVLKGDMEAGVQAATEDLVLCSKWLKGLQENGLSVRAENVEF